MLEYVGIIIGCICVAAIAIVGYYLYNKCSAQQTTIEQLIARQMTIEGILTRPPPRQELASVISGGGRYEDAECEECNVVPIRLDDTSAYIDDHDDHDHDERRDIREYDMDK